MNTILRMGLAATLASALLAVSACESEQPPSSSESASPTGTSSMPEETELRISETLCEDWKVAVAPINADSVEYFTRGMDTTLVAATANCYIEPVERPGSVPEGSDFVKLNVQINNLRYPSYSDLGEDSLDLLNASDPIDSESYLYNEYDEPDRGTRACWDEVDAAACRSAAGIDGRIWAYYFKGDYQDIQFDVEVLYLTADQSDAMAQVTRVWALDAWAAIAATGIDSIEE